MLRTLVLSVMVLGSLVEAAPQSSTGIIEGVVTRNGTTEGLASVRITITREGQEELEGEPEAMTDAGGFFRIANAAPGPYVIRAARPGYYDPSDTGVGRENRGASKKIVVDLQQPLKNIDFALGLAGTLAGRAFDPTGRPAENVRVEAIVVGDDGTTRSAKSTQTNDQGDYRLWGLKPGKYYVAIENSQGYGRQQSTLRDSWARTYFPGVLDLSKATPLDITDGLALENVAFGFQTGQTFKISGTVVDPGRDSRTGSPDFYLIPDSGDNKVTEAPRMATNSSMGARAGQPGAFEIRGVRAGRYILYAEDWKSAANQLENFVASQTLIDVRSDISGLTMVMSPTSTVEGTVLDAEKKPLPNARVALIPPAEQRGHPKFFKEVKANASGRFTVTGVMPGDYTVFAINPAAFQEEPPPTSVYSLPSFLAPWEQQGVAIHAKPEERLNVSVPVIRK